MKKNARTVAALVLCSMAVAIALAMWARAGNASPMDTLILLLPDDTSFSDSKVTVWLDAANEEGLHVRPMHDSAFLRPVFGRPKCAGLILPDSIHQDASDIFLSAIRDYVRTGGHLMLVYDAATKSMQGFYPGDRSRLSDLAGVDYALYKNLGSSMIRVNPISSTIKIMKQLGLPPGKYFPFAENSPAHEGSTTTQLRRYEYGNLEYPNFVTSGSYAGQILLQSNAGVAAGYNRFGRGSVLFVNLPLGYLKADTDGLPLHVFLRYFAVQVLSLPRLLAVPDGVGGLILNWHVDSNAAISALQAMKTWTILQQGPYSIDITAGPDTYAFNDHLGFDVLHNAVSQNLVREYVKLGDEIGSHGGWIHNYFSSHIETDPPEKMAQLLQLNKDALEQVTGKRVEEYAAPNGDQPQWVTRWLESHGFVAYYFTGDAGMGPTQGYRGGQREGQNIWAFPVSVMDRAASFEEFSGEDVSFKTIQDWLEALTNFAAEHQEARLLYFHPPGILPYRAVVCNWLEQTAALKVDGRFRWYTMTGLATFLNSRKKSTWSTSEQSGWLSLDASNPETLAHETWSLPASRFEKPVVVQGSAMVSKTGDAWIIDADDAHRVEVRARTIAQ